MSIADTVGGLVKMGSNDSDKSMSGNVVIKHYMQYKNLQYIPSNPEIACADHKYYDNTGNTLVCTTNSRCLFFVELASLDVQHLGC